jgi:NitT/TauT family transport system substrate-binding protein
MNFISRKGWAIFALAAAALHAPLASAKDELSVIMGLTAAGPDAALFLAAEKGWYDEANLHVTISEGRGSMMGAQMIATGRSDLGQIDLGPMIVAYEGGAPLVAITGWARRGTLSIVVDNTPSIKSFTDLKGKRIGLLAAGPWTALLDPFLKHVGSTRGEFTFVNIEPKALFASYSAGSVDAMMTIGPYVLPIINPKRPSKLLDLADYGLASPGSGLVTSRKTLTEKRDALERFIGTQIKAWHYIYDGHIDEAAKAIDAQNPNAKLDLAILKGQIEAYHPYLETPATKGKPLGWQAKEDWDLAFETYKEAGLIKRGKSASEYYTNELFDKAFK